MVSDATPRLPITGLVLTYNGERLLDKCLASLDFCQEILVIDSFSTDATQAIAERHGARFIPHAFEGHLPQFAFALSQVATPWVITLDQDEICSDELRASVLAALPEAPARICGYQVPRRSWYLDRFIRHSGWYPDLLLRVFRREGVFFTQNGAHEKINPHGATGQLQGDIIHYPYASFANQWDKLNSYADLGAAALAKKGVRPGLLRAVGHALGCFLRMYVLKKGFLDGTPGFLIAVNEAFYVFAKYARLLPGAWGVPYNHHEKAE